MYNLSRAAAGFVIQRPADLVMVGASRASERQTGDEPLDSRAADIVYCEVKCNARGQTFFRCRERGLSAGMTGLDFSGWRERIPSWLCLALQRRYESEERNSESRVSVSMPDGCVPILVSSFWFYSTIAFSVMWYKYIAPARRINRFLFTSFSGL